jgi:hypothetical protein
MLGSVFPCSKSLGFTELGEYTIPVAWMGANFFTMSAKPMIPTMVEMIPSKTTFFVSWHQTNAYLCDVRVVTNYGTL